MLTKVIMLVQKNIIHALQSLSGDLAAHKVELAIYVGGNTYEEIRTKSEPTEFIQAEQETLYITDSETVYHALRQQGRYVLPCRHGGNGNANFTGALYVIEQIEEIGYETVDMAYRRLAGLPWEILTTKRCVIRETIPKDVDSFYQIYAEPDVTRYMEELYADRDEEIAYIEDYRDSVYRFYGYGMWTVQLKDGTVIGRAGISWREGFELPELGFVIGVPWQRQGYAYEVCSAILTYARNELNMAQIQALVMAGNEKSSALCRKLGFQYVEDIALDGALYARMVRRDGEMCD